jgi:hypothetical protein
VLASYHPLHLFSFLTFDIIVHLFYPLLRS